MGWETRGNNGKRYYYRAKKIGGRVVKEYLCKGSSDVLTLAGDHDQTADRFLRASAQLARIQQAEVDQRLAEIDQVVAGYCAEVKQVVDAALTASGYHCHKRSGWRKKRMVANQISNVGTGWTHEQVQAANGVFNAAVGGDKTALPAARKALDQLTVANGGNLPFSLTTSAKIIDLWTRHFTSSKTPNLMERECIERELLELVATLAGPNPSPLERLLAERVMVCHAHVQYSEMAYQGVSNTSAPIGQHRLFLDRIASAERRYLAAIKTLAQVRRLQLPTMQIALPGATQIGQINVGEKQINVATQQANVTPDPVRRRAPS